MTLPGGVIQIDTHHEVSAYQDMPRQLLVSSNGAPVTDIAMDGPALPDNTPNGVVYTNPNLDDFERAPRGIAVSQQHAFVAGEKRLRVFPTTPWLVIVQQQWLLAFLGAAKHPLSVPGKTV